MVEVGHGKRSRRLRVSRRLGQELDHNDLRLSGWPMSPHVITERETYASQDDGADGRLYGELAVLVAQVAL